MDARASRPATNAPTKKYAAATMPQLTASSVLRFSIEKRLSSGCTSHLLASITAFTNQLPWVGPEDVEQDAEHDDRGDGTRDESDYPGE
jgi:hypothetical protein